MERRPGAEGEDEADPYGGPDGPVISKESESSGPLLAPDAGFLQPMSLPFHLAWGGIPFSRDITTLGRLEGPGAEGTRLVLLDAARSFAAEFNMNYSKWQGRSTRP